MPYLNCPRCGLTILPKTDWLIVEDCPRCIARCRTRVAMIASDAPGGAREGAGAILDTTRARSPTDGVS